eukprot:TRINITY_DN7871_c0_g1::TRINITY_DN7871_c0_g1_i1::g.23689::m.23689 TRINITY_DN7871_c0_g1::TRINITY_DN7871_c0_g1_i1::g.23689  ORF type:complete len:191 (-),score=18.49 TRINITY_DN7871_c0_g1_i1:59-592(-)
MSFVRSLARTFQPAVRSFSGLVDGGAGAKFVNYRMTQDSMNKIKNSLGNQGDLDFAIEVGYIRIGFKSAEAAANAANSFKAGDLSFVRHTGRNPHQVVFFGKGMRSDVLRTLRTDLEKQYGRLVRVTNIYGPYYQVLFVEPEAASKVLAQTNITLNGIEFNTMESVPPKSARPSKQD